MEVLELNLSASVFDALDATLPNEGHHMVRSVDVTEGWGYVHYVTVYCGLRRHDPSAELLEEAIRTTVAEVLGPRRFTTRIRWGA